MPPEDRIRVLHMIEATETALGFVTARQRADLNSDQMLLFALVRAIEVIGEAAGRVSETTREAAADIPWSLIVSMRNRLIYAYFDVDNDVVWKTQPKNCRRCCQSSAHWSASGERSPRA